LGKNEVDGYGWCWREDKKEQLFTTEALSELILKSLLEVHQKVDAGEIVRKSRYYKSGTEWS